MKNLNAFPPSEVLTSSHPGSARRLFLQAGVCSLVAAAPAWAQRQPPQPAASQPQAEAQPKPDSLRLACDEALMDSGLVVAWLRAFANDTGVAVTPSAAPVTEALKQLERGEAHMSLTNDPDRELELERQGLAHTRTMVGGGSFVVVGPAAAAKTLKEVIAAKREPEATMMGDVMQAIAQQGVLFLSRPDGSGTHRFEELLWGVAKIKPEGAWYRRAQGDVPHWLHAKDMGACAVVEKGVWAQLGQRSGLTVLADNDPALNIGLHLMRSFRVRHPASKLFSQWVTGSTGQWVLSRRAGYRTLAQARL